MADELQIRVKANLDTSGIKEDIQNINKQLASGEQKIKINADLSGLNDINKAIESKVNKVKITPNVDVSSFMKNINSALGVGGSEIKKAYQEYIQTIALAPSDKARIESSYANLKDNILSSMEVIPQKGEKEWSIFERIINECTTTLVKFDTQSVSTANAVEKTATAVKDVSKFIGNYPREFANTSSALDLAEQKFKALNNQATVSGSWIKNESGNLDGFVVNVKKASGVVERFRYSLEQIDDYDSVFSFKGITGSDSGINTTLNQATTAATKLTTSLEKVKAGYTDINSAKSISEDTHKQELANQYANVESAIERVRTADSNSMSQMKANADSEIEKLKSMVTQFQNAEYAATKLRTKDVSTVKIDESNKLDAFISKIARTKGDFTELNSDINTLKASLSNVTDKESLTTYLNQLSNVETKFDALNSKAKTDSLFAKEKENANNLSIQIKKLISDIETYENLNAKAMKSSKIGSNGSTYQQSLNDYTTQLKESLTALADGTPYEQVKQKVQSVNKGFASLKSEVKSVGLTGQTVFGKLGEAVKKFASWMSITTVISAAAREIRQLYTYVVDIDTAMVSLKKVTDETDASYTKFLEKSCDNAKKLGVAVSDLVEQTATWAKLGYSLSDSTNLAQVSGIYANVGEVDNQTAVSDLVTAMKAFNIEAKDSITIVDQLNELSNNYAVGASDLGEGLSNAASAMALGGMSLEKTLALITGGSEITQSANELGNALKIGQMRVMGMKGALEELGEEYDDVESVSKIQTHILNLTEGQVNIMDKADPTKFRDYYDILKDISEIYDSLDATKSADLLETMFGKQRGNQGAALIQAFQSGQIEKAYKTALNSQNSAYEEQAKWLDSIEAKQKQLVASAQSLANTSISTDMVKNIVDGLSDIVSFLDKIISDVGLLPTLITPIITALSFKNAGEKVNTPTYAPLQICA